MNQEHAPIEEWENSSLFYDSESYVKRLEGSLPHWRQDGKIYFVTFRLADSLPQEKLQQLRLERIKWLNDNPLPHTHVQLREYFAWFADRPQRWLDAGYGSCVLENREIKTMVEQALCHFSGEKYDLDTFTVAANHVHVILAPARGYELSKILHSWKSFTGHQILKNSAARSALEKSWRVICDGEERPLKVWQKESFDHIIRGTGSLEKLGSTLRIMGVDVGDGEVIWMDNWISGGTPLPPYAATFFSAAIARVVKWWKRRLAAYLTLEIPFSNRKLAKRKALTISSGHREPGDVQEVYWGSWALMWEMGR